MKSNTSKPLNLTKDHDILLALKTLLKECSSKTRATILSRFFQTHQGGYGQGDIFIGVTVPDLRKIAKKYYAQISNRDVEQLLKDEIHEHRLLAIFLLILKYEKSTCQKVKEIIFNIYFKNLEYINNWDLVDSSAYQILGPHLFDQKHDILYQFSKSDNLWIQRIAIIATFYFIKKHQFDDTFKLAEIYLVHNHDLIHKAVGWMLREVGKRNYEQELQFIKAHSSQMPRTMLRYAIEKFDENLRKKILQGSF